LRGMLRILGEKKGVIYGTLVNSIMHILSVHPLD